MVRFRNKEIDLSKSLNCSHTMEEKEVTKGTTQSDNCSHPANERTGLDEISGTFFCKECSKLVYE